jgi:hypothetical protein
VGIVQLLVVKRRRTSVVKNLKRVAKRIVSVVQKFSILLFFLFVLRIGSEI